MCSKNEKRRKKVDKVKRRCELRAKFGNSISSHPNDFVTDVLFTAAVSIAICTILYVCRPLDDTNNAKSLLPNHLNYSADIISEHLFLKEIVSCENLDTVDVIYERKGGTPIQPFPEEEIINDAQEILAEPVLDDENNLIYEDLGKIDRDIVDYMYKVGEEHDIPGEILQAIAKIESNYDPDAISKSNDHGLMQINASNFKWLSKKGINDWYDPYQSIDAAIIIIEETRKSANTNNDWNKILMAYNSGVGNAKKKWKKGIYSSAYSKEVLATAEEFGYGD